MYNSKKALNSGVLLEEGTDATAPDIADAKLLQEDSTNPFVEGEYIYGSTSGSVAKIKVINNKVLIVDTISGSGFAIGETITGRDGNRTGTIKTYKENQIVANNRLLDYGDIDQTLETFLNYFQKDFIPSLDLKDTQNKRLTLKNIGSLYKQKGTADSVKFLMRILYGQNAEVKYPIDETIPFTVAVYVMIPSLSTIDTTRFGWNVPLCVSDIDTEYCLFVTFKGST